MREMRENMYCAKMSTFTVDNSLHFSNIVKVCLMLKHETYFKFPIASLSLKGCLQGIGAQFFNSADITDEVRGVKGE